MHTEEATSFAPIANDHAKAMKAPTTGIHRYTGSQRDAPKAIGDGAGIHDGAGAGIQDGADAGTCTKAGGGMCKLAKNGAAAWTSGAASNSFTGLGIC